MSKVLVKGRFSFAHVFKPDVIPGSNDEPKYSISVLIPKSDKATIKAIEAAIENAKKEALAKKWGGKAPAPAKFVSPLKDGDEERPDDEAYAGHFFISAKSKTRPGVVGPDKAPLTEADNEFYSGCYGYASVTAFGYNHATGGKGISFALNNVMKTKDGEPFGAGGATAEEDFKDIEADDDDIY